MEGIKNQAVCGASYAFAAIGALEFYYKRMGGTSSLSEQQLIDCSRPFGNKACDGGNLDASYLYAKEKGIMSDNDYPYYGYQTACAYVADKVKVKAFNYY